VVGASTRSFALDHAATWSAVRSRSSTEPIGPVARLFDWSDVESNDPLCPECWSREFSDA
jgi:hypothetical protein